MHNARGELPHRRELLRLREPLLRLAPFRDVFADRDHVRDVDVVEAHRNLCDAVKARLARRCGLHLDLRQLARLEHAIELVLQ